MSGILAILRSGWRRRYVQQFLAYLPDPFMAFLPGQPDRTRPLHQHRIPLLARLRQQNVLYRQGVERLRGIQARPGMRFLASAMCARCTCLPV
jgi:hypothetical protein